MEPVVRMILEDSIRRDIRSEVSVTIGNYRPTSLLNTDFKIFTKILARRVGHVLGDLMQKHQYAQLGSQISAAIILLLDLLRLLITTRKDILSYLIFRRLSTR